MLGLSVVHMNRTLQQLRESGLVVVRKGMLRIPDPEALANVCGWELESATSGVGSLAASTPRSFAVVARPAVAGGPGGDHAPC